MKLLKDILLAWEHERSERLAKWLWSWKLEPLAIMPAAFVLLLIIALTVDSAAIVAVFFMVVALSPFWLPLYLGNFFWTGWIHYIRFEFWFSQEHVLLEIQLPPEVEKTPKAMELFLSALFSTGGEGTFIQRTWKGQFRPIWSLEMASHEGQIKFYLHMRKGVKDVVEARLYGQYPEAQVRVVDDYVARVPFNFEEYELFGAEYTKAAAQAVPIMTYVDYELDKNPDKPETQVDPITQILEFMGQMGPGEHLWFQIVARGRKKDEWYGFELKEDSYEAGAKKAIEGIVNGAIDRAIGKEKPGDEKDKEKRNQMKTRGAQILSEEERERVNAIERQLTKLVFECGPRVLYIAKKEKFRPPNAGSVALFFMQGFRHPGYNFMPPIRGTAYFDYPWQDFNNIRRTKEKKNLYFRYKHRANFFVPYDQVPVCLTTEELATIWHFPSSVVKTPALSRVPARVSEAPINLPTGSK